MASTARVSAGVESRFEVWRTATLEGIFFAKGSGLTHSYPRHWHDEIHFCAYNQGYGYFACRGAQAVVGEGDLVITPPGEVHENWVDSAEGIGFVGAYVEVRTLRAWMAEITEGKSRLPSFPELVVRNDFVLRSFRRVCNGEDGLEREQAVLEFVAELLSTCVADRSAPSAADEEPRAIRRAREYIDENFERSISLAELGQLAGISTFHLHRVFCRQVGMPPHAYQNQVRINHAKRLLRERRSLSDVAQLTGFTDQSHFTRHFRRLVGVTPGRFLA